MKNKNHMNRRKKRGNGLTIALLLSGFVMTGIVVWVWMNDWDIEQSFQRVMGSASPSEEASKPEEDSSVLLPTGGEVEEDAPGNPAENPAGTEPKPAVDAGGYIIGQQLPDEPTYVQDILIASKKYPLPKEYDPGEDPEARAAFNNMAAEAKLSGFHLTAFSTYRSFEYQTTLYERYVERDGKEAADRYSARPGYSEHQTGLAFDIGEVNFETHWASPTFEETEAGKWVAANAHRYGFIMRYPKGKEEITGYMYEAWHFRYVGEKIAGEIYEKNSTLEEFLGIE
ncbi:M15 family metallopeptidase [Sporosarcina sp. 179-K 3D1 HS]|uniref:M15 family metallopeptidase n=1 Tax=Sporosarcina sp. 179-K 3D1 HS TaxID=3232169 RepID=UPI0039A2448B